MLILKLIIYKVDVENLNKMQICKILPYFFQLLGMTEFCKFEVCLIFHINLDKHTTWTFENNNLLVHFFLGEMFLCVILTQKIVNTFYDTI